MYFDTHAHYDAPQFDADRDALLEALPAQGVGLVLNCGSDLETSRVSVALAARHAHVYAAVGIHPESAAGFTEADVAAVEALCREEKVVAVGEIGLDYHYEDAAPPETQMALLRAQLTLARELGLPVVIHDRDAHADSLRIAQEFSGLRGVFHCYSGSVELARELTKLGWHFSFGGAATFKNARKIPEVVASLPADRLLLETDCPYLAPVPFRGRRCDSSMLPHTCAALARFRGCSSEELAALTLENGLRLFRIGQTAQEHR